MEIPFSIVDIQEESRGYVTFVLRDTNNCTLSIKTRDYNLFTVSKCYEIGISHTLICYQRPASFIHHGVVTRKTRKAVRISSGSTLWVVTHDMCKFNPGIDVWIHVTTGWYKWWQYWSFFFPKLQNTKNRGTLRMEYCMCAFHETGVVCFEHESCFEYAYNNMCTSTALKGNLGCLKYAHENGCLERVWERVWGIKMGKVEIWTSLLSWLRIRVWGILRRKSSTKNSETHAVDSRPEFFFWHK